MRLQREKTRVRRFAHHLERRSGRHLEREGFRQRSRCQRLVPIAERATQRTRELLVRSEPDRVAVLLTRKRGQRLSIPRRPLWELSIDETARLRVCPRPQGAPDLVIAEPTQVLYVRFP